MKNKNSFLLVLLSLSFNTFGMEIVTKKLTDTHLHGWRLDKEYFQYVSIIPASFDITQELVTSHTDDYKAIIHNRATMEAIISFPHPAGIWSASFHPTGKYLATGSIDHCIRIFDIDNKKEIALIKCNESIKEVGFDRNGRLLAKTHSGTTLAYVNDDKSAEKQFLKELLEEYLSFSTNTQKMDFPATLLTTLAEEFNLDKDQLTIVWNTLSEDTQKLLFEQTQKLLLKRLQAIKLSDNKY